MKYKEDYLWSLAGRFVPLLIYLLATMILSRFLNPEDFGKVGVLSIFFVVANTLMDAGLGGSLVKEPQLKFVDCSTIFVFNIIVSHFLYFLLFIFSGTIESYFNVEGLAIITKILCIVFVINSWGLVPRSILTRDLEFRKLAIINIIAALVAAFTSVIMAILQFGVFALVAYQIVNGIVSVISSIKVCRFKISFRFSRQSFIRLIPFGFYTTLSTIIDTIYENLTTFLFGKFLNMQQAGFLYQAKRLEEVPSQALATTISNVAFPVLTKIRNNHNRFVTECKVTFKSVLLLALPVLFSIAIFSEPIIIIILGKQWGAASGYLTLLIFAAVFHIAETLNRTFIKSTTQVAKLFKYTIAKRIVGVTLIFIFLFASPSLILIGYIISTFVGFLFNVVLLSKVSQLSIKDQLRLFFIVVLPSLVYYVVMSFVQGIIPILIVQITIAILLLLIYYLGILKFYRINLSQYFNRLLWQK